MYTVDTLNKGMIPVPGGTEQHGERLHQATQIGTQFKTHQLLISGIFHLTILKIFLNPGLAHSRLTPWKANRELLQYIGCLLCVRHGAKCDT